MSEERIITAATITTGEKNDGKQLEALIENSTNAGMVVENVIGDAAYSEKGNIEYANENEIKLVAKLTPSVHRDFVKKKTNLNLIKTLGCMFVKLDIWPFAKHVKIEKPKSTMRELNTTLT